MTPNNDEIKRIMGDHAALAANYKNVPPLARGNPGPAAVSVKELILRKQTATPVN